MEKIELYILIPVIAMAILFVIVNPVRKIAKRLNLVDNPGARKVHVNKVPLVGGILVTMSASLSLIITSETGIILNSYSVLVIGSLVLLIMGIIDDKVDLRSTIKLLVQIALAHYVFISGIRIDSMFGIFGYYHIPFAFQYVLTLVIIVGVMNAFNLMDGIDGLSAGLTIIGLIAYTIIAFLIGLDGLVALFIALIGALIAFLRFNLSKNNKIFMGDAGSLVLGFIIVVSGIELIQVANTSDFINPTMAVVIGVLALPVGDSLRVYRRRIKAGYSPFRADKTHFHHLVLHFGVDHKKASIGIVIVSMAILLVSVFFGTYYNFTYAIISMLFVFILASKIVALNYQLKNWSAKIYKLENR